MIDQLATATAVAEVMAQYFSTNPPVPICRDANASVLAMWRGTRFEAISKLWNYGSANLELIIDPTKHPKLIYKILDKSTAFLDVHEPSQDETSDTISAILRVYQYLSELQHSVGYAHFQVSKESPANVTPYANFIIQMRKLYAEWEIFRFAVRAGVALPRQPDTVFLVIWRDVTAMSKTIACCGRFGPHYMATYETVREKLKDNPDDLKKTDESFVGILSLDDPDHHVPLS